MKPCHFNRATVVHDNGGVVEMSQDLTMVDAAHSQEGKLRRKTACIHSSEGSQKLNEPTIKDDDGERLNQSVAKKKGEQERTCDVLSGKWSDHRIICKISSNSYLNKMVFPRQKWSLRTGLGITGRGITGRGITGRGITGRGRKVLNSAPTTPVQASLLSSAQPTLTSSSFPSAEAAKHRHSLGNVVKLLAIILALCTVASADLPQCKSCSIIFSEASLPL